MTLERAFGRSRVFQDVDAVRPGQEWGRVIEDALHAASALVVVMSCDWAEIPHDHGHGRRIDDHGDWVRREIEDAIERGRFRSIRC